MQAELAHEELLLAALQKELNNDFLRLLTHVWEAGNKKVEDLLLH